MHRGSLFKRVHHCVIHQSILKFRRENRTISRTTLESTSSFFRDSIKSVVKMSRQTDIRKFFLRSSNRSISSSVIENASYLNGPPINHVHGLLLATADGKGILKAYATDNKLHRNKRSLLTRLIHAFEKNKAVKPVSITGEPAHLHDFQISEDRCRELSRQIVELFPNENRGVYYNHGVCLKMYRGGKLKVHHAYAKSVMRKNKLIKKPSIIRKRKPKNFIKRLVRNENNNWVLIDLTQN